ncbi:hypothetical protein LINGRAHAP2_LOCUS10760 [Linum grandiflorum]
MFAIFQEQYAHVQESNSSPYYPTRRMDCIAMLCINCTKMSAWMTELLRVTYQPGRLGETANGGTQWASYVGIHSRLCTSKLLSDMISLAHFPMPTFCPGWTRGARTAYAYLYVAKPLIREEEEDERYVHLHGMFGSIVRVVYKIEELHEFINTAADTLATQVYHGLSLYDQRTRSLHNIDEISQSGVRQNYGP